MPVVSILICMCSHHHNGHHLKSKCLLIKGLCCMPLAHLWPWPWPWPWIWPWLCRWYTITGAYATVLLGHVIWNGCFGWGNKAQSWLKPDHVHMQSQLITLCISETYTQTHIQVWKHPLTNHNQMTHPNQIRNAAYPYRALFLKVYMAYWGRLRRRALQR